MGFSFFTHFYRLFITLLFIYSEIRILKQNQRNNTDNIISIIYANLIPQTASDHILSAF